MPKLLGPYAINLAPAVALLHGKIDTLVKHAEQENRFIYFQVVPTLLPELPAEASVMNPPKYEEPVYSGEAVVFAYKAPKSMLGAIFSSLMGSSEDTSKPAAADTAVDPSATGAAVDASAPVSASAPPTITPGAAPVYPYAAAGAPSGGYAPHSNNSNSYAQQQADEAYARQLQQQYNSSAPPPPPMQQQYVQSPPGVVVPNNGVSYPKL